MNETQPRWDHPAVRSWLNERPKSALSCRSPLQRCLSGAGKDARRLGRALTRFRGFKSTLGQLRNRWIDGRHSSPEMRGLPELGASCLSLRPRKVGDRRSPSRADAASHWPPIHLLTRPADLRVGDSESCTGSNQRPRLRCAVTSGVGILIQGDEFKTMVNKFFSRSVLDSRQLRLFSPQGRI
jgi:hypothetical protein